MKTTIVFAMATLAIMTMEIEAGGKKGNDIVYIGNHCEPTIIKSSGKKGKYGSTVIMKPNCKQDNYGQNNEYEHQQQQYQMIPVMYAEPYGYGGYEPHGYGGYGYGSGSYSTGYGHGGYGHGGQSYGHGGKEYSSYGHGGYITGSYF